MVAATVKEEKRGFTISDKLPHFICINGAMHTEQTEEMTVISKIIKIHKCAVLVLTI